MTWGQMENIVAVVAKWTIQLVAHDVHVFQDVYVFQYSDFHAT